MTVASLAKPKHASATSRWSPHNQAAEAVAAAGGNLVTTFQPRRSLAASRSFARRTIMTSWQKVL